MAVPPSTVNSEVTLLPHRLVTEDSITLFREVDIFWEVSFMVT